LDGVSGWKKQKPHDCTLTKQTQSNSVTMVVAAVISNLAQFVAAIVPTARILWAIARERGRRQLVPKCFSWSIKVRGVVVPIVAVVATVNVKSCRVVVSLSQPLPLRRICRLLHLCCRSTSQYKFIWCFDSSI
jgi:hypothetical protein